MGANFRVKLVGEQIVARRLANVAERIADWSPIWPQIRQWFYQTNRETFLREGFGHWPRLAPSTVARRIKLGFPGAHPILKMTGRLERSLTGRSFESLDVATPTKIELGTTVPYAIFHQKGSGHHFVKGEYGGVRVVSGAAKGGKRAFGTAGMPPRPPLIFGYTALPGLRRIINGYIHEIAQQEK